MSKAALANPEEGTRIMSKDVDPLRPLAEQLDEEDEETAAAIEAIAGETTETPTDAENRGNSTTKRQKKDKPPKEEPVARTFSIADIAGPIAKLLISDHYPALVHSDIRYIFTSKASEIEGKPVVCKPAKISGLSAWLGNGSGDGEACPFFVVVISEGHFESMGQRGKEAFLDHALAHFDISKSGALKLKRPDITQHAAVLQRHGAYTDDLKKQFKQIEKVMLQPSLALEEGGA